LITALDTNILLDILIPDPEFGEASAELVSQSLEEGEVVICEIVYAELAASFSKQDDLDEFLASTGIQLVNSSPAALAAAGRAWAAYRKRRKTGIRCSSCGAPVKTGCPRCGRRLEGRQHLVADFLVGGHALEAGDRLITRDQGYYARYFPALRLVGPEPQARKT
jgi:predicted nucleic acid-binding protein